VTLYADVLVAINYFVSYAMLCCCRRLAGVALPRRRAVLGALVGGLCSLYVFLPLQGAAAGLLARAASAAAMLLAAWPGRRPAEYLRLGAILLTVSFLFAGAVLGWCLLFPQSPVGLCGGAVYFHVTPVTLLVSVTLAYLLLEWVRRMFGRRGTQKNLCRARLRRGGGSVELQLLCDTGNTLTEPFSGLPVVVCTLEAVRPLLTPRELAWWNGGADPARLPPGLRLVGYRAVGGGGMLGAFRPDSLELCRGEERWDCPVWVGADPHPMPGCDGVFGPELLELRI